MAGSEDGEDQDNSIINHFELCDNDPSRSLSDVSDSIEKTDVPDIENDLNFIYTNARSLPAKMGSLITAFNELELHFAVVSETWLRSGSTYDRESRKLLHSESIDIVARNRSSRGGGVAILFNNRKIALRKVKIKNDKFELTAAVGRTTAHARKVFVIAAYFPPKMKSEEVSEMNEIISSIVGQAKTSYEDPLFVFCGDINKKNMNIFMADHPDVAPVDTPPTRKGEVLDICFSNATPENMLIQIRPPLTSSYGTDSDHRVVFGSVKFPKQRHFKKEKITLRPYTKTGEKKFGELLARTCWQHIYSMDANQAADEFNRTLQEYVQVCFPAKTITVRESDPPWLNRNVRRASRRKKRHYKRHGKTAAWNELDKLSEEAVKDAKVSFWHKVKKRVRESGNMRAYYAAVNMMKTKEAPRRWSPRDLFPGKPAYETANEFADFFASISQQYHPLPEPVQVEDPPKLELHEVSLKLRFCKKPRSKVKGDIDRRLVSKFNDLLAIPLLHVYNEALRTATWPDLWKTETVRLLPKKKIPQGIQDVRNIACTPLFSKVLEHFLLKNLQQSLRPSTRQYGGVRGSGIDHFLCEVWHDMMMALEDGQAAANLTSIDFSKAYNRMDHTACVLALSVARVPAKWVKMVEAFLHGRRMSVHLDGEESEMKSLPGGAPQGSVLGGYLFCVTTDFLSLPPPETANTTPTFEENGNSRSLEHDTSGDEPISPIRPPSEIQFLDGSDWSDPLSSDDDLLPFQCGRGGRGLLDSTIMSDRFDQSAIDEFVGTDNWVRQPPIIKAYVDDFNVFEKVRVAGSVSHVSSGKTKYTIHATGSQSVFVNVEEKAKEIGMSVNSEKTHLLCIHPSLETESYIEVRDEHGNKSRLTSGDGLKILGFHFGKRPDAGEHVDHMVKSFAGKLWSLRFLRRSGMGEDDLLHIYTTTLRPFIDFAAPSYHSLLNKSQTAAIERLQLNAAKIIFGTDVSYNTVLRSGKLNTLEARRKELFTAFARKTVGNERYSSSWFPKSRQTPHDLRRKETYLIPHLKTDRAYKSPIIAMRRALNRE